jgi:uncharacterized protein YcnI
MKYRFAIHLLAACAASLGAAASFAHVTLQDGAAAAGSAYRATLRLGHGCEGSATTAVQVTLPPGFNGAQPMVKPGWTVSTRVGQLAEPYEMHGSRFTEGVLEVTWTAKGAENALPDAYYDEFVLRGSTPKKPGPVWFKVVQSCEKGSNAWVQVPASGTSVHGLKFPAALLDVLDVQASDNHSH